MPKKKKLRIQPCIIEAKRKIYKHIETILFQNERALYILDTREQRKRNLKRGQ